MKLIEFLSERLRQPIPKQERTHPFPVGKIPEDERWIWDGGKDEADVEGVLYDILGKDRVTLDPDKAKPGDIYVWRSTANGKGATFTPDESGVGIIKVPDGYQSKNHGDTARRIASAAHEAYHALLWLKDKNFVNEQLVNKLATRWLQDHLSGMFLHAALEKLRQSKISYKHTRKTYLPSSRVERKGKQAADTNYYKPGFKGDDDTRI